MGKVIASIKRQISAVVKANQKAKTARRFVLVPFNDPKVGPVTVTANEKKLFKAVSRLRARGGGDCPEKSLSGLAAAADSVQRNSIIYLFTDASASDWKKRSAVLRKLRSKRLQLVILASGHLCRRRGVRQYRYLIRRSSVRGKLLSIRRVDSVMSFIKRAITHGAEKMRRLNRSSLSRFTRSCRCKSVRRAVRTRVSKYVRAAVCASATSRTSCSKRRCSRLSRCVVRQYRRGKRLVRTTRCVPRSVGCPRCRRGYRCAFRYYGVKTRRGRRIVTVRRTRAYCRKNKNNPCKRVRCGRFRRCQLTYRRAKRGRWSVRAVCRSAVIKPTKCRRNASRSIRNIRRRLGLARRQHSRRVSASRKRLRRDMSRRRRTVSSKPRTVHACENSSVRVSCSRGYRIQILRGFYGRTSNRYCARGPRKTYSCSSKAANSRIARSCNNKRSCTVRSSNSVFGDPCRGTYKYTTVRYRCRKTVTTSAKTVRSRHSRRVRSLVRRYKRTRANLKKRLRSAYRRRSRCGRRPSPRCPRGYKRLNRTTCVQYYYVCPQHYSRMRTGRSFVCVRYDRVCRRGQLLFNGKCYRKCPAGSSKSGRSCKVVKKCGSLLLGTRCVKSCPSQFISIGRSCHRCPRGTVRRGNRCVRSRLFCRRGYVFGRRCVRRCPRSTLRRGRRCTRIRCSRGAVPRYSKRRRRVICVRRRQCKGKSVYYSGSCKSKCPKGTKRRSWYCLRQCGKGYTRVGFRRQRCIRPACYRRFRLGRSRCVRRCPVGYIGVRRTCRRVVFTCPTGYYRFGRALCFKKCPVGFVAAGRRCRRKSCAKGSVRFSGVCMKTCPSGTKRRGAYCFKPSKCKAGRFAYSGKCLRACPPSHYRSFARRSCIRKKRCIKGQLRLRRLCVKSCPLGFSPQGSVCKRQSFCRDGLSYRGVCMRSGAKCPARTMALRGTCMRTAGLCPRSRYLLIRGARRSCVRRCPRNFIASRSLAACLPRFCPIGTVPSGATCRRKPKKQCAKGTYRLRSNCVKKCPKGTKARVARRVCSRVISNKKCATGRFRYRGVCRQSCPRGMRRVSVKRGTAKVQTCRAKCGNRYILGKKCVPKCPSSYRALRRRSIRFCRRTCPKAKLFAFRGRCRSRCPKGFRKVTARVGRGAKRIRVRSCRRAGCRRGYKLVYRLRSSGRKRGLRLKAVCSKIRSKRCRLPSALFFGRCVRRCPRGYLRRRLRRSSRYGVCRASPRIRLCRRRRCGSGRVCRVVRKTRVVRRGSRVFRRRTLRAVCAPKTCNRRQLRFRGRCVRRCPSGYSAGTRRLRSGRRIRRCTRSQCRYPRSRLGRRCVRRCPRGFYRRSFRSRRSRARVAVCRRSLCSQVRCPSGYSCRMLSVKRRRYATCRRSGSKPPSMPKCRAGLVVFRRRCRRRCPRRYRAVSTRRGRRVVKRCVRDACSRKRYFLFDRCTRSCPRGFNARRIRYSRSYSFRYCQPKPCRGRLFRAGRRCVRRCPFGFRRRYMRVGRSSVRRYCLSYICRRGYYKLGKRCVRNCGKSRVKKTIRRGSRSYGVCAVKNCAKGRAFIGGRCRKPLKGCYDRLYTCRSLARRKKCSKAVTAFLCPVACGRCSPKKQKQCTCSAIGDPHYRTFDGKWIHFQGKCKYLLAQSKLSKNSACNFKVTVKNELRGKRRNVSWTRFVDISMSGVRVRLHQKRRVYINGKLARKLPVSLFRSGKKIRVYRSGKRVVAESKYCGFYLEWNGKSIAELHLPKARYAGKVTGICGNCNGNVKDDLRTKAGKDVSRLGRSGQAAIGQSYSVPDDSKSKRYRCKVKPAKDVCSKSMRRKVASSKFCGMIRDRRGPFSKCLKSGKVKYSSLYKTCRFDVCEYRSSRNRRRAVCESVEALYDACLAAGFRVKWRSRRFCPMRCRPNSTFKSQASGCPRTCADVGRRRRCRLPSREACVCKKGFVLNGRSCVPEATCGKSLPADVAFVIDGTDDISKDEFDSLKSLTIKLLTRYRLAMDSLRPAAVVFGRMSPRIRLLSSRPSKTSFMQFLRRLRRTGGSANNLRAALMAVNRVVLKARGGARPDAQKFVIVLTKSSVPAAASSQLLQLRKDKTRVVVVQLPSRSRSNAPLAGGEKLIPASMPPFPILPKLFKELEAKRPGCAAGFRSVAGRCVDVNECSSKNAPCHSDSTCVNLPGSFVCLCPRGLSHDRVKGCVKPVRAPAKCPKKPKCASGYAYNAKLKKCSDIDECKDNPCIGSAATCRNSLGSFSCSCPAGFQYSKHFGCIDVDECKTKKEPCSGAGKCVNTLGAYKCACDAGFSYVKGAGCSDVDECKLGQHNCKGGASCVNKPGSFKCECKDGFRYLKEACVDINECAENATLCDASATCVNQQPGFKCQCNLGNNWVHRAGKGCVPDEAKGFRTRNVNFYFVIDGSDQLKASLKDIKMFMSRLLDLFARKEVPGLKARASAVVSAGSQAATQFKEQPLPRLSRSINSMNAPGGKQNVLPGLQAAAKLANSSSDASTNIVVLITASSVKPGDKNLPAIKKLMDNFKATGKAFTVHISPSAKPSHWANIYASAEISRYVTVIRSSYLATIAKLIYKRMYILIQCPPGFIKVDGLCQLQTAAVRYCKTDSGELRPVGSKWEEECSQFECTAAGVQVLSRKCLGYDGHCYSTEAYFPCTQVTGSLSWRCRCKLRTVLNKRTGKKLQFLHYQSIAFKAEVVNTDKNRNCVFPFKYRNKWLYNCDEYSGKYWCSFSHYHQTGKWGYCKIKSSKNKCTDPFNSKKIYVEGDRWNHGCNVMECTHAGLKRIPKCRAADGTCKPLNSDGYSCKIGKQLHSSCLCVQSSSGWGRNQIVSGDKAKVLTSSGGSVVSMCLDVSSGKRYEQGQKWTVSCFTYQCTATGGKLLSSGCQGQGGSCHAFGDKGFKCVIKGKNFSDCSCGKDKSGNPLVRAVVAGKAFAEIRHKVQISTSVKAMAMEMKKTVKG